MARVKIDRNLYYDDERKKYYVSLYYGVEPVTGKRIKLNLTFSNKKDAKKALTRHEADFNEGKTVLPQELTLGDWLERWMKTVVEVNREETTIYAYRNIVKHV
ncbi:MAG: Arm DNA-binding domain-containing protein [Eubacteriales bacterium]